MAPPPALFVLLMWSGLAAAQVRFEDQGKITSAINSVKSIPQHNPLQGHLKPSTFTKPEQTRFAPDGLESLDSLGVLTDKECQQCSITDRELALRCCQSRRTCCSSILSPEPGVQTGQIPPEAFPGPSRLSGPLPRQTPDHAGPPGLIGSLGEKVGACPVVTRRVPTGFSRFADDACVAECSGDFHCPDLLKCCPVGCSTVCLTPQGAIHPTTKPGSCPKQSSLGFPGHRLGVLGLSSASKNPAAISPETLARILEQQDEKERRLNRKERRGERRRRRSLPEEEQNVNFLKQSHSRVTRSFHRPEQDDHRERQRNRWERNRGRIQRSTEVDHQDDRLGHAQLDGIRSDENDEGEATIIRRVARQAGPHQPGFLVDPSCQDECFTDFDCPANLKCCFQGKNCRLCFSPTFI
nr:uncharacterized protein LOC123759894 [Procambarus clarkii]